MATTDFSTTVEDTIEVDLDNVQVITKIEIDGTSLKQSPSGVLEVLGVSDGKGNVIGYNEIKEATEKVYSKSYVFDTYEIFLHWIAGTYNRPDGVKPSVLKLGDEIWFKEENTPDAWYSDDTTKPITIRNFSSLETKLPTASEVGAVNYIYSVDGNTSTIEHNDNGITCRKTEYIINNDGLKEYTKDISTTLKDGNVDVFNNLTQEYIRPSVNGEEVATLNDIQTAIANVSNLLGETNDLGVE